ncbi:LPD1 domain-containing protein [Mesobacillus sp.]|uniref:LPD1 domain-containing protein n=1 Tax=Mesobacillus sp. TaxID=2675271 RepID=UPI0039EE9B0B
MENQLSLFQAATEGPVLFDIRTEQQTNKKVAYDVGEKMGGARKDLAALRKAFEDHQSSTILDEIEGVSSILAAEIITKSELFKRFNLADEKEKGTEPSAARAKQLLIQRVNSAPVEDSKEVRLKFMKAAQHLLSVLEPVKTIDDLYPVLHELSGHIRCETYDIGFLERKVNSIKEELNTLEKGSDDWKSLYSQGMSYKRTLKKAKESQDLILSVLGEKFCNFFKSKASYMSTLKNAIKIQSWDELLEKKEGKKGVSRRPVWERTLPERPDRIGGPQSPIEKPEDLLEFFGYRGVQFGHYVEDQKGIEHLLRSSEAMMDLAGILDIDYTSLSLGGALGMAYGARGRGGNALAHFEPMSNVINMTKERGCLGVFGHEWWHALDCYIHLLSHKSKNGRIGFASNPESLGTGIEPLIEILFRELIDAIMVGDSIAHYENTNKPEIRWRGTYFKQVYNRHNGNLFEAMKEKIEESEKTLQSDMAFYSRFSQQSDKKIEKMKKKIERDNKSFAQALAWYHEQQTGERVDRIPYPSDKSNYFQQSLVLDRQKEGKYWSSSVELTARAFESYIQDKLKASGRKSDYLVAGTRDGIAFPMGEERERINQKFDLIIKLLKENKII